MSSPARTVRKSLFIRIARLFLAGGLASILVAGLTGRLLYSNEERPRSLLRNHIAEVTTLLATQVSQDPTPAGIASLAARHPDRPLAVWEGDRVLFSNLPDAVQPQDFSAGAFPPDDRVRIKSLPDRLYASIDLGSRQVAVCFDIRAPRAMVVKGFLLLISVLAVIFFLVYRFVSRLLSPLGGLVQATQEFSRGNFTCRLPDSESAEFDELVAAFRQMAERLETAFVNNALVAGNVAHDLRFYLTRLRMTVEVDVADENARRSLIEDLDGLSRHLDQALEASRIGARKATYTFVPVVLEDLVAEALAAVHRPDREVGLDLEPGLKLLLDPHYFRILLVNLLDNARKYGSEIQVQTKTRGGSGCLESSPAGSPNEGNRFSLTIRNRPLLEMDPAALPFLSQPFFRPGKGREKETGGSGLGLFIARQIAEAHHFSLEISLSEGWFSVLIAGECGSALPPKK